ncbi:MAG: ABC transporter substrate-binding protein [Anaerofustis sp.]
MKKLFALILAAALLFGISGCKAQSDTFNVGTLKGPSGIGMIKMISENATDNTIGDTTVNFTIAGAPDDITAKLLSGELDAAAVPMNTAAILYNKTNGGFVIASVNTLGVIYIVENGTSVNSISDLVGKTVYMGGQGSTADIAFRYTLSLYGIDPDTDLHIVYVTEHSEAAAYVASTEGGIALLPEPYVTSVTMKNANTRVALDLTQLYEEKSDSSLMMTAFVVNKDFAEAYPGTVDAFLKQYKESVDYVNGNVSDAANLVAQYGILASADIAAKAIPNCNIIFEYASDNKTDITNLLNVFYNYNPASVGGSVPGDDFYYEK